MLKNVLFIFICLLLSKALYADSDKNQLSTLPKDAFIGLDNLRYFEQPSTTHSQLPEDTFADLHNLKPLELCPGNLQQATAAVEYNQVMQEGASKLNALDQDQILEHFVSEHTFENCLRSIKDTMMDPNSTKDGALQVATCFNVDDFSTPKEDTEVEILVIEDMREQLSNILELIKQRVELVYGALSFEHREALIACTEYSGLW